MTGCLWFGDIFTSYICLQGSVGSILGRKDDTNTQDIVCQQLGNDERLFWGASGGSSSVDVVSLLLLQI